MTHRENDAEALEGEDTEEREPRFLDEEGINPETDEAFEEMVEQSIEDER